MKNWKTTLSSALAALPAFLAAIGVHLPPTLASIIAGSGILLTGYHAADASNVPQK